MVRFRESDHTYWDGDRKVPGVTTILKPISNYDGIPRHVLEAKAKVGIAVHLACDLDDDGLLDESSVDPTVGAYLESWRRLRSGIGAEPIEHEVIVHHKQLGYAGTLDNLMLVKGELVLVDKKTTSDLMPSVGPQTAAYAAAYQGRTPDIPRACAWLRPDGYEWVPLNDPKDWSVFVACLTVHNFKARTNK